MGMKPSQVYDELIKEIQESFEKLEDHRRGENTRYEIKDAAVGQLTDRKLARKTLWSERQLYAQSHGRSGAPYISARGRSQHARA